MIVTLVRATGLLGLLVAAAPPAVGVERKEIDRSIKAGADALKARYNRPPNAPPLTPNPEGYGVGPTALTGLALLEAGVPVADPVLKTVIGRIRDAAYKQHKTYQIAACLMFLERLGEPADVPLIQMLAVRLIVGQLADGGWNYECCAAVPAADEQRLRAALKEIPPPAGGAKGPPRLHPDLDKYGQSLLAARKAPGGGVGPGQADTSNTQFAVLGLWMARKHGVAVEGALDLVEKRFRLMQAPRTGNWPYHPPTPEKLGTLDAPSGTASMYCAGLLGMATALARREDRLRLNPLKADAAKKPDPRDLVVARAFAGLGLTVADRIRTRKTLLDPDAPTVGENDLYFLWSLERVCVVYGLDAVGRIDWYDHCATAIVRAQKPDGTWDIGPYGPEVNTALAVLVLCKANLVGDLSNKVQRDPAGTELRAGTGPSGTNLLPDRPADAGAIPPPPAPLALPNPKGDPGVAMASVLLKSTGDDWARLLAEARDGKGPNFTRALVVAAENADGDRKKQAREALAERLCRMSAATLRGMLKADEAELRRAAALACAMKDDRDHVPDLVALLEDRDEGVWRAAKAGLKSLTGQDLGPATGADKAAAVRAWREWLAKQKK